MGGWLTSRAMVTSSDIKAGVIWGGVVAGLRRASDGRPGDRLLADSLNAACSNAMSLYTAHPLPPGNPALWQDLLANYFLDDLAGPVRLYHPQGDSLPIIGTTSDRFWWQVQSKDKKAWVAAAVTVAVHTAKEPVIK